MWGVLRRFAVGAALCSALTVVPAARAASGGIPGNETFTFTGGLTYTWHGDPARGCARQGLCSVIGSISFRADGSSQSVGGLARLYNVDATGTSTVRVARGAAGAVGPGSGDCVEIDSTADVSLLLRSVSRTSAVGVGSLSSGRCAGPTSVDLGRVRIPIRISGAPLRTVDFSGRVPFVAGPFSGTLASTLVLRPQGTSGGSITTSSGSSGTPTRRKLIEFVDLRYRVSSPPSALVTSFAGTSAPLCELLDSCGVTGSLTVSLVGRGETVQLEAERVVDRRVGRARALADLLARRLVLYGGPLSVSGIGLRVGELTERGGAPDCADAVIVGAVPYLGPTLSFDERRSGTLTTALFVPPSGPEGPGTDLLRTHCPGPASADIVGSSSGAQQYLVRGTVPLGHLLDRHLSVSLTNSGSFGSPGYTGSRRGSIALSLSLLSARAGTRRGLQ